MCSLCSILSVIICSFISDCRASASVSSYLNKFSVTSEVFFAQIYVEICYLVSYFWSETIHSVFRVCVMYKLLDCYFIGFQGCGGDLYSITLQNWQLSRNDLWKDRVECRSPQNGRLDIFIHFIYTYKYIQAVRMCVRLLSWIYRQTCPQ